MNERRLSESVERILEEPEFELHVNEKERLRSRICDILDAIGIEGSDEFGLEFLSAAKPGLSPSELAKRLKQFEGHACDFRKALSALRSPDRGGTDTDDRAANIEVATALVREMRLSHIVETGEATPVVDASLGLILQHMINRIGYLEEIAAKAASRASIQIHKGQPRKSLLDTALVSFANVYCEFFEKQSDPFDLTASEASPFIRLTHAALGRESLSAASLVKRWERLRDEDRKAQRYLKSCTRVQLQPPDSPRH